MEQRKVEREKEKLDKAMGRSQPKFMAVKPGHKLEKGFHSVATATGAPKKLAKYVLNLFLIF